MSAQRSFLDDAATRGSPRKTVLSSMVRAFVRVAAERGVDTEPILREVGIDRGALLQEDGRVPLDAYVAAWREVERIVGDPAFGVTAAMSEATSSAFGVVGYLAMTSADVREALARAVSFHSVLKERTTMRMRDVPAGAAVELMAARESYVRPDTMADYVLASLVGLARRWTGEHIVPLAVDFERGTPPSVAHYTRFFGTDRIAFDRPNYAVVFSAATLRLPMKMAQPDLAAYLERAAAAARPEPPRGTALEARAAVRTALSGGAPSVANVARALGLSVRTLQRRLEQEGLVFQRLVDHVRRDEALTLLSFTRTPLAEIGERVGYADPKAFRRAFRRWTGTNPQAFRRDSRRDGDPPSR